ncbi:hypothetical protein CEUSTIGMA_g10918.t1 [Chlamydomonas eustigma]|uniref:Uncharacterized protein n=1 Tax=Chlamydomonas eustigma TaxID=1157962 RepID=A0A250XKD5_9CHLO|nr:hypothetical protein CEUSTIGMA_g10918.t1 [Chlamydomonas eustigma]|eukprot:GAX83493.1 hypothetical protein CEUSTIGMA_g10918.t1 [Chlamydomonas eustigma]
MKNTLNLGRQITGYKETTEDLRQCCEELWLICSSSYGPLGRCKILQAYDDSGSSVVTSMSARLAQGINFKHRLLNLLVQTTIVPQHTYYGDGGLLSAMLASKFILAALEESGSRARRLQWAAALQQINIWLSTLSEEGMTGVLGARLTDSPLAAAVMSIRSSGVNSYLAVVRNVIASKQVCGKLTERTLTKLSSLVVEAFLEALPEEVPSGGSTMIEQSPFVRVTAVTGLNLDRSFKVPGLLLDVHVAEQCAQLLPLGQRHERWLTFPTSGTQHSAGGGRGVVQSGTQLGDMAPLLVAVFDIALEPSPLKSGNEGSGTEDMGGGVLGLQGGISAVHVASMGEEWSLQDSEMQHLYALVKHLSSMGVRVIACQKGIHTSVQHAALSFGILPLQRLSLLHIHAVAALTGALPVSSVNNFSTLQNCLGLLGGVGLLQVGNKLLLALTPSAGASSPNQQTPTTLNTSAQRRCRPVQTLVLGAASELAAEELRPVVDAALKVLMRAVREPDQLLPGGGCAEALLAAYIRRLGSQTAAEGAANMKSGIQAKATEIAASSLELMASHLMSPVAGRVDAITAVRSLHQHVQDQLRVLKDGNLSLEMPEIQFIGWNTSQNLFSSVVTGKLACNPSSCTDACAHLMVHVKSALLLEPLGIKMGAITAGLEAACMMLKIDATVCDIS